MNNFGNLSQTTQRLKHENHYRVARANLLLVVVVTLINIILAIAQADIYFLFSASIPYLLTLLGMVYCGKFPEEFYTGELADAAFLPPSAFGVFVGIALVIIALYFLTWLFSSKNRVGWLITALVFFCCDTLLLFVYYGIDFSMLFDYIFHIWVLVYLCLGVVGHYKLKAMPEPAAPVADGSLSPDADFAQPTVSEEPDSIPLRTADMSVKARTLLEFEACGHQVLYRRVKRTNELVIDGRVYGEYTALAEKPHFLVARINGHEIGVGMDATSRSLGLVDGETVAQKLRIF